MTTLNPSCHEEQAPQPPDPRDKSGKRATHKVALVGNPNAGKTSLFNALTGLRAKTANYPGITTELRHGSVRCGSHPVNLIDLPGTYSLRAASRDERIAVDTVLGRNGDKHEPPDALIILLDATNLERNLYLAGEVIELGIPTVVALNMIDLAERRGMKIDTDELARQLGCPVVKTCAIKKRGTRELQEHVGKLIAGEPDGYTPTIPMLLRMPEGCPSHMRYEWAEKVVSAVVHTHGNAFGRRSETIDSYLTHPLIGLPVFALVMLGIFYLIFSLANVPMDLIDGLFGDLGNWVSRTLPEGQLNSLIVDGVIAGVGGTLIFLPQICILFFLISLLEDTGYLARAAFVMDKVMRHVGLPGKAFVPMLSAHACAIPGIMAARTIENKRDRFATILVLPLMTCSARLPVYAMVTALLFPDSAFKGAVVFTAAYALGITAAISAAWMLKRTILKGEAEPLILELPSYKTPSLRNALLTAWDRGIVFVKKAGTVILAIMIVLWWLSSYPTLPESGPRAETAQAQIESLVAAGEASELAEGQVALEHSFAGRMGKLIEPVIQPLGFDWKVGVGIVTSFAARETVVGTLGVVYGVGDEAVDDPEPLLDRIREAKHPDGSPVFTTAACLSLLVFYVLAMQCLPTQAVTRRETGSWKWALFQLGYMTALAYTASLITYQAASALGFG